MLGYDEGACGPGWPAWAPPALDGAPVLPGREYVFCRGPEAGLMAGRRVACVGVDPEGGFALYVDAAAPDLIDKAPSRLLMPVGAR